MAVSVALAVLELTRLDQLDQASLTEIYLPPSSS